MSMRLTVKPLKKKDANRGLAAIDRSAMKELGVTNGDFIKIESGTNSTVVRVWPGYPDDDNKDIVRIDGLVRQKLGVGIDYRVEVTETEVKDAERVVIGLPSQLRVKGDISPMLYEQLGGRPISEGEKVNLQIGLGMFGGQKAVPFKILKTEPSGTVVITDSTQVEVREQPQESIQSGGPGSQGMSSGSMDAMTSVTYEDIGGLEDELEQVREMIELPMRHPELFQHLGIDPPKGVLLHGPPGTGKTLIARAVANEVDASFYTVSGPEIMSKYYGESEEQLREIFEEAENNDPSIVFIDELDSIAPERGEATGDVERRVVAQLLSLMDGLDDRGEVVVIGATNRVNALDPALRRGGRFDREIEIGAPDKMGRKEIFQVHTRGMPLADDVDLDEYAENTHGFVGADIEALTKEAAMTTLRRIRPEIDLESDQIDAELLESIEVTEQDFKVALRDIEPSALREVFVEVPDVTWSEIGGLQETKDRLKETVQWPLNYPDVFEAMDVDAANGILLYGPPGTGKTLLAKAIANESESNFISVKGPELLNKYVGESEKGVREIFSKARENAPTVVFFDEIDAIATERGQNTGDSGVSERVVSQLLTELDGLEALEDVVVIATTNRPDLMDNALLRPGRLDRHLHVPVPDKDARKAIFDVHTRNKPVDDDVDLDWLAEQTDGYVGADIEAVCREASMAATRELINRNPDEVDADELANTRVSMKHFEHALDEVGPSVTEEIQEQYEELEERFDKASVDENKELKVGRTFH